MSASVAAPIAASARVEPSPPPARRLRTAVRPGAAVVLASVIVGFALIVPGFARLANLADVVEQSTVLALLGFGMTLVMIAGGNDVVRGGIDLSLAATLGLSDAVFTAVSAAGHGDALAVAAALATGLAIGAVNATASVGFGVLPLLATLATMNACAGLELVVTQNTVLTTTSPLLGFISNAGALGLSATDWVLVATTVALLALTEATPIGLRLRAVGAHPRAARAAGLAVRRTRAACFVVAGGFAAIAAVVQAARLSGSSPGSGDDLLPAVLCALLGAVFSRRLEPTIGGTLVAVLFIGCLANVFQLLDMSSYLVNGVEGLLILTVVLLRAIAGRRAGAVSR